MKYYNCKTNTSSTKSCNQIITFKKQILWSMGQIKGLSHKDIFHFCK